MAVPNRNNISLQDVTNEIYGDTNTGRNLAECFADANPDGFAYNYEGFKDNLSNFRAYEHEPLLIITLEPVGVSRTGRFSSSSACGDTSSVTRYSTRNRMSQSGDIIYEDSDGLARFDGKGKWFKFGTRQTFIVSSTGVLGTGTICP
jgi:hypothetical protein